jgi:transcriptional regulator with XRE-family HTH domain
MARAALSLGVRELAEVAGVSSDTISRLERGDPLRGRTVDAIRAALEAAGVIFIAENGEGPGVRLRKRDTAVASAATVHSSKVESATSPRRPSTRRSMMASRRLNRKRTESAN